MRNSAIKFFGFILIGLLISACSHTSNKVRIKGNISGIEVRSITLYELDVYESKVLDEKRLGGNGKFSFETTCSETSLLFLSADNNDYIVLVVNPGEDISISAESWSIAQSYSVSGSPESALLRQYREGYYKSLNELAEANRSLIQSRAEDNYAEIHADLTQKMEQIVQDQKREAEKFIRAHPESLTSLLILNDKFGQSYLFNDEDNLELLELLDNGLMKAYPGNKHTLEHHARVEQARSIQSSNS